MLTLRAAFRDGTASVLATDLAGGGDLRNAMAAWPAGIPPPLALDLALQVATAVEHMHGRGVAHCDLKPENVLLSRPLSSAGGSAATVAQVADFGMAACFDPDVHGFQPVFVDGGTLDYMGIEGLRGDGHDPRAADAHALGVLLCELLCGHRPYLVADDEAGCPDAHRQARASRPDLSHRVWRDVDDEVLRLVKALLCAEWWERPSAREAVMVLEEAVCRSRDMDLLCAME